MIRIKLIKNKTGITIQLSLHIYDHSQGTNNYFKF